MGRKGIEITLNLDTDCGNHFKDLHFRPAAKNVLLTVYHQEEMCSLGRESAHLSKLRGTRWRFVPPTTFIYPMTANRVVSCSLNITWKKT